jgi:general secretion pathway protein G
VNKLRIIFWLVTILLVFALITLITLPHVDGYKIKSAQGAIQQMVIITNALERFKKDTQRYPFTREGLKILIHNYENINNWKGPYLDKDEINFQFNGDISQDVWGSPYRYFFPPQYNKKEPYDFYSWGKNKTDDWGEKDDITNWKEINRKYYDNSEIGLQGLDTPIKRVSIVLIILISILFIIIISFISIRFIIKILLKKPI